ncbi:hypothetical protein [Streptomyces sp. NPDC059262]|uniref:hypothetical protein n=1 Tax=Streptomyces sp. NPDC059262 TaxID=3346797 RepID=UPI00369E32EE
MAPPLGLGVVEQQGELRQRDALDLLGGDRLLAGSTGVRELGRTEGGTFDPKATGGLLVTWIAAR